MTTRRHFIEIVPLAGLALLAACSEKAPAPAATPAPAPAAEAPAAPPAAAAAPANTTPVDPAEPAAQALGYVNDATKADAAKFKTYTAGQNCANCALFAGKPGDASGGCPLFGGRTVSAAGWCSGHAKKAS